MRVVILERSPPTLAAVGVWISGAFWPTRGISVNSPTTALGSSVAVSLVALLDQRRRSATRRRWGSRRWCCRRRWRRRGRRPSSWRGRRAGWRGSRSPPGRADRGLVERLGRCRLLRRPGFGGAPPVPFGLRRHLGEVEGDLGVGDLGAVRCEDAERVAVLALVEDHRGRARRPGRRDRRRRLSTSPRVLPWALGKSLFGGAGRLSAVPVLWWRSRRGRARSAAAAGQEGAAREQAGEQRLTTRPERIAPCY